MTNGRCLIIWSLGPGGSERVLSTIANEWARRGNDVTVVTMAPPSDDHYALDTRVQRMTLNIDDRFAERPALVHNAQIVYRLRRVLRDIRPDVIVSFIEGTNTRVLLATRGLPATVIVSERTDPRHHHISRVEAWLRRLTYPWADAIVVQTEAVRTWAESTAPADRVHVVPNPVRPCGEKREDAGRTCIVSVGRLVPSKGYDTLIEAFARVAPEHPNWDLHVVGEGPERERLEGLIHQLGLANRVRLLGLLDDPRTILRGAGLFVLASRYEGFPNALLEAMSCGVPVLSTDCPSGPREMITDGESGFLVPVDDVPRMATVMSRLLSDPELRMRIGTEARTATSSYSLEQIVQRWEELIQSARDR